MHAILRRKASQSENIVQQGFTLVEVMIAGVIMVLVMAAVSRLSITALSSGSNQAKRERIEAAIINNIHMLQKEDSYLRLEALGSEQERKDACNAPAETLARVLGDRVAPPTVDDINQTITRDFVPTNDSGLDLLIVEYSFIAPTNQEKNQNYKERRTIELNPNFTSKCYTTGT